MTLSTRATLCTADTQVPFADLQPELIGGSLTQSPERLARSCATLAANERPIVVIAEVVVLHAALDALEAGGSSHPCSRC